MRDALSKELLGKTSAPLVAYDGAHLELLRGCTLGGHYTSKPLGPDAAGGLTTRVLASAEELDAHLLFRDPALVIESTPPGQRPEGLGLPIAVTTIPAEEWSLAALDHNAPPSSDACARATHLVRGVRFGASSWRRHDGTGGVELPLGVSLQDSKDAEIARDALLDAETRGRCVVAAGTDCHHPLSMTLVPLGASHADDAATLVHFRPKPGEDWSVELDGVSVCKVPCEHWILPGAAVTLLRSDGEALMMRDDFPGGGERDLVISSVRDPLYPWFGVVIGAVGAGFTGLTIGLATGDVQQSTAPGGGSSGGFLAEQGKKVLGIGVMGLMGAGFDIWSLVYLASGPRPIPTFQLEMPGKHTGSGPRKSKAGAAFTASPSGIGISF